MSSTQKEDAALLGRMFTERGNLVSRRKLADASGIRAEDLASRLAPFVEAGYPIQFHPQGGIELLEPPDIWCAEEVIGRLCLPGGKPILMWNPLLLAETASTNDVAREQGRKGAKAGFVVAASRQTRGRGRLGRAWESTANRGLYVSMLLRP